MTSLQVTEQAQQASYLLGVLQAYLQMDIKGFPAPNESKAAMVRLIEAYANGDSETVAAWIANHGNVKG